MESIRIKAADLTPELLTRFPVWTWYEGSPFEAEDEIRPVDVSAISDCEGATLMIRATFTTPSGRTLCGMVTYDLDFDEVFAVEIMCEDMSFGFNKHASDLVADELESLRTAIGEPGGAIFPLTYETDVVIRADAKASGRFDPSPGE